MVVQVQLVRSSDSSALVGMRQLPPQFTWAASSSGSRTVFRASELVAEGSLYDDVVLPKYLIHLVEEYDVVLAVWNGAFTQL